MDFIEQLFGVSPDGGNGMVELSILVVLFSGIAIYSLWHRRGRDRRASRGRAAQ